MGKLVRWLLFRDLEALPSGVLKKLILQASVYPSKRIGIARQYVAVVCWYSAVMFLLVTLISHLDESEPSTFSYMLVLLIPIAAIVLIVLVNNWVLRRRIERMVLERWERGRPPNCLHCDYDLRGSDGANCPECGERIPNLHEIIGTSVPPER